MDFPKHEQRGETTSPFLEERGISPILFTFGGLFLILVLYQVVGGAITFIIIGNPVTANVNGLRLMTMITQLTFMLLPALLLTKVLTNRMGTFYGWRIPSLFEVAITLLALFALMQLGQIYITLQSLIPLPEPLKGLMDQFQRMVEQAYRMIVAVESPLELLWVVLIVAFTPAIVEEVTFRGFAYGGLLQRFNPRTTVILTGIVFALFHGNPFALVPLSALGIFFGFLRLRSMSIILPMTAHFANNVAAILAYYFGFSESLAGSVVPEDIEPGLLLQTGLLWLSVLIMALYVYVRITDSLHHSPDDLGGKNEMNG